MIQKVYNCSALLWCSLPRICHVEISNLVVADSSKQKTPKLCLCGVNVLPGKTGFKQIILRVSVQFSLVQSLSHVWLFVAPWIAACNSRPSPTPRVHPNSCLSSWWCHPAISASVVPFSSCPQSLPASESLPMTQLFAWGGQSIGVSALASVLPKNTQDYRMDWLDLLAVQGTWRVFSNTTVQKHQFFGAQLSSQSNSHSHTRLLGNQKIYNCVLKIRSANTCTHTHTHIHSLTHRLFKPLSLLYLDLEWGYAPY